MPPVEKEQDGASELPTEEHRGMPIYEDSRVRSIVDSLDEQLSEGWYPANAMALKLWHCLEALRDIEVALESAAAQKNATKRKRQLKQFSVQLHTFAGSVVRLCDQIVGDPDARQWLKPGITAEVAEIKSEFSELVPIDHKGDLSLIRNRMGGHIDRELSPEGARDILSRQALSHFGRWLHVCIHALLDLMKLNVFAWSVHSESDDVVRFMNCEPFLVTFRTGGGQIQEIHAVHLSKRSPRMAVVDLIEVVIEHSQWMFRRGERRIRSLKIDKDTNWNTFRGSLASWSTNI